MDPGAIEVVQNRDFRQSRFYKNRKQFITQNYMT